MVRCVYLCWRPARFDTAAPGKSAKIFLCVCVCVVIVVFCFLSPGLVFHTTSGVGGVRYRKMLLSGSWLGRWHGSRGVAWACLGIGVAFCSIFGNVCQTSSRVNLRYLPGSPLKGLYGSVTALEISGVSTGFQGL